MWVFLASHDWISSSTKYQQPAAEASVQQLDFSQDKQQHAEALQLGFHVRQELANPTYLGFPHTQHYAKPDQLGFPDELHPAAAADHVRFHMNVRRLTNGAPTPTTAAQVSPSIVVIIIVLTVIFFLSAFLHLLIRWLARNPALIRRSARAGARSNNRIIALTALQGQLQQLFNLQDAGLERSLIEELPVFSYKAAMGGLKEGADCAICLCEFLGEDQLRLLPLCGHAFHTECIDTWLLSHSTCPLCRALLVPDCWIPGMLQPFLSSEMSTTGEHINIDAIVPAVSGHFTGSSRRSSAAHITIMAEELQSLHNNPLIPTPARRMDPAISDDAGFTNPASSETSAVSSMANSALMEDRANRVTHKGVNEGTSCANAKSFRSSSSAYIAAMVDSGRLSYTSLGNQTDALSDTYNDLDGASMYGSGRRVSVHLGKCRMVREQGKSARKSKAGGDASRRSSYSKGSYEYVIDSSSNLEVLIPPVSTLNPHSKRLNDPLNLSYQKSASAAPEILSTGAQGSRGSVSKNLSPSWASASFRKLRLCDGGDDVGTSMEAINAPLNTLLPSDRPGSIDRWPVVITPGLPESSAATSMRANVGSDVSFSPGMLSQRLGEVMLGCNGALAELETSKRAVSFRLPTPASHDALSTRLQASASRRALSESEAFSYWEPTVTEQNSPDHAGDAQRLVCNDDNGSHRSSSFAKRTIDWLVGWQKRTVHPDKSAQADTSCNYLS